MKKKVTALTIFILLSIIFVCLNKDNEIYNEHVLIKAIEADKFYIDFNNNNKADDNELAKLYGITAFKPYLADFSKTEAQKLNILPIDYAKNGLLARSWAINNLEGKKVKVFKTNKIDAFSKAQLVKIKLENDDLATLELKNGLSYLNLNCKHFDYFQFLNKKQINTNIKEISKTRLLVLNKNSNMLHKLNCEHIKDIKFAQIVFEKDVLDKYNKCKNCFNNEIQKQKNLNVANKKFLKSQYKQFNDIELYLISPLEFKKPNSTCETQICKRIVKEINQAQSEINLALYGFGEQEEIFNALRNAKNRGVKIKSVVDFSKNMDSIYPNTKKFIKEFNSKLDNSEALMHNKFVIFDKKKVLVGSANFSSAGTGGYNSNNVLIINNKNVAKIFIEEFNQMYNGKFSINKNEIYSPEINLENSKIEVLFSPVNSTLKKQLLKEIQNAKNEIFVSIFYLTDKSVIKELILAKQRGLDVLIIVDSVFASGFKDRLNLLRNAKIPTKVENWGGKNHEKTMVIDNKIFITGSCNFSASGFNKNNESIVIIKNTEVANFYREYFITLYKQIDDIYLTKIPRAEGIESINSCFDGLDNNYDGKIDREDEACKIK